MRWCLFLNPAIMRLIVPAEIAGAVLLLHAEDAQVIATTPKKHRGAQGVLTYR
jgi:hypothetical protein